MGGLAFGARVAIRLTESGRLQDSVARRALRPPRFCGAKTTAAGDSGLAVPPSGTCALSFFSALARSASSASVGFMRTAVPVTIVPASVSIPENGACIGGDHEIVVGAALDDSPRAVPVGSKLFLLLEPTRVTGHVTPIAGYETSF